MHSVLEFLSAHARINVTRHIEISLTAVHDFAKTILFAT